MIKAEIVLALYNELPETEAERFHRALGVVKAELGKPNLTGKSDAEVTEYLIRKIKKKAHALT